MIKNECSQLNTFPIQHENGAFIIFKKIRFVQKEIL